MWPRRSHRPLLSTASSTRALLFLCLVLWILPAVPVRAVGAGQRIYERPPGGANPVDAYGRPTFDVGDDGRLTPLRPSPLPEDALPSEGAAPAVGDPLLRPYQLIPLSLHASAVAIGDVTGDGRPDIVAIGASWLSPDSVYVLAQTPSGALAAPVAYRAPRCDWDTFGGSVAIADMNHDGRLDVIMTLSNAVGVMLQKTDGRLAPALSFPSAYAQSPNDLFKLVTGDFNHDGLADVAGIDWGGAYQGVELFLQAPAGLLEPVKVYPARYDGFDDLEAGDVNGDGWDDLVVMNGQGYDYSTLAVLTQSAQGGFDAPSYYDLGSRQLSNALAVGDVNGDGRNEVVLTYGSSGPSAQLAIFPQAPNGLLGTPLLHGTYDAPGPVTVADVNLDGRQDVVILHGGWLAMGVCLQNPDGTLATEVTFPIPYSTFFNVHGVAVGDVNGDGKPDVVIADPNRGVMVLYNNLPTVVACAGRDTTVECVSQDGRGTPVRLDGRGSEGPGLSFAWSAPGVVFDDRSSPSPTGWFPLGVSAVVLEVSSGGRSARDTVLVTVRDTAAPTLRLSVEPAVLWPPDHELVPVRVSAAGADACDPAPLVRLVAITCGEADRAPGRPDSADVAGASFGEPDFDVLLRAERLGNGPGRTYTLVYEAADVSGNAVRESVQVVAPHSQGRAGEIERSSALADDRASGAKAPRFAIRHASNPVSGSARLEFELPEAGRTRLRVFDLGGRVLATLVDGTLPAGAHAAPFAPGRDAPAQIVFYLLEWNGRRLAGRLALVR